MSNAMTMSTCPFSTTTQLNDELVLERTCGEPRIRRSDQAAIPTLPGQPLVGLDSLGVAEHLHIEFLTPDLNRLSPYLWLVTTQSSSHILPLHHQLVKGRKIVITEDPELHAVWAYGTIFFKPIANFVLSEPFWEFYLLENTSAVSKDDRYEAVKALKGFLRTYCHLIKHKSDYDIAVRHHLIPENLQWSKFAHFLQDISNIVDDEVSPRYAFGELRLTRLNLCTRIFLRRLVFRNLHGQYGTYFASFFGPLLFTFGFFSIILSSMQVFLASNTFPGQSHDLVAAGIVFRRFSTGTMVFICLLGLLFLLIVVVGLFRELVFALGDLWSRRRSTRSNAIEVARSGYAVQ